MSSGRILITGGCGFIGRGLIDDLLQRYPDWPICLLDNLTTGQPEDLAETCEFEQVTEPAEIGRSHQHVVLMQGDIRDPTTVTGCAQHASRIVHLAANTGVGPSVEDPRADMEANVIGTFNVLEAARQTGVRQVIFASSGAPAGEVEPPIHEELPPHPVSPYGASKLAGEGYCSAYSRTFGVRTACLRFGNIFGPGSLRKGSVVAKFIRQALHGETCEIFGHGRQTRDFIYIQDLIRAIVSCMESDVSGETFQIASGRERTVGEVAEQIGSSLRRYQVSMQIRHGARRAGDVLRNYSDTSKAKAHLGWQVETPFEQGIDQTVDYFVERWRDGRL